jgi:hypothetical protein
MVAQVQFQSMPRQRHIACTPGCAFMGPPNSFKVTREGKPSEGVILKEEAAETVAYREGNRSAT